MKEYRLSRGIRRVVFVFASLAMLICTIALVFIIADNTIKTSSAYYAKIGLFLLFIFISAWSVLEVIRAKYEITNERVVMHHAFGRRELLHSDIAGYRGGHRNDRLVLIPKKSSKSRIQISAYTKNFAEIKRWVEIYFKPFAEVQEGNLENSILQDENFGVTKTAHVRFRHRAKQTALAINVTGVIIGFWALFSPIPYEWVVGTVFLFPFVCLFLLRRFRGLLRIEQRKQGPFQNIVWGLLISTGLFALWVGIHFTTFNVKDLYLPVLALAGIAFWGYWLLTKGQYWSFSRSRESLVVLGFILLIWAYGAVAGFNCVYDYSQPQIFTAQVLDLYTTKARRESTHHYAKLTPWGPRTSPEAVGVKLRFYESLKVGDSVTILFRQGRFQIPWYQLKNNF